MPYSLYHLYLSDWRLANIDTVYVVFDTVHSFYLQSFSEWYTYHHITPSYMYNGMYKGDLGVAYPG